MQHLIALKNAMSSGRVCALCGDWTIFSRRSSSATIFLAPSSFHTSMFLSAGISFSCQSILSPVTRLYLQGIASQRSVVPTISLINNKKSNSSAVNAINRRGKHTRKHTRKHTTDPNAYPRGYACDLKYLKNSIEIFPCNDESNPTPPDNKRQRGDS